VAAGSAIAAVGLALALDGPALVAGWAAESVLIGWVARRSGDRRGYVASAAFLAVAAAHALVFEASPKSLAYGLGSVPQAVVALVLVGAACGALAWIVGPDEEVFEQPLLMLAAAAFALYLGSVLVVELAGGHPGSVQQHAQLALSAFWAVL